MLAPCSQAPGFLGWTPGQLPSAPPWSGKKSKFSDPRTMQLGWSPALAFQQALGVSLIHHRFKRKQTVVNYSQRQFTQGQVQGSPLRGARGASLRKVHLSLDVKDELEASYYSIF